MSTAWQKVLDPGRAADWGDVPWKGAGENQWSHRITPRRIADARVILARHTLGELDGMCACGRVLPCPVATTVTRFLPSSLWRAVQPGVYVRLHRWSVPQPAEGGPPPGRWDGALA